MTTVSTYENAIAQFDEWLGEQAEFFKQNPQVNRTFLDWLTKQAQQEAAPVAKERRCPFGCLQTDGGEPCICAGCRPVPVAKEEATAEQAHHELNENTWCVRCNRFDPAGPCPGKPAPQPHATTGGDRLVTALRTVADGDPCIDACTAFRLLANLLEGGKP